MKWIFCFPRIQRHEAEIKKIHGMSWTAVPPAIPAPSINNQLHFFCLIPQKKLRVDDWLTPLAPAAVSFIFSRFIQLQPTPSQPAQSPRQAGLLSCSLFSSFLFNFIHWFNKSIHEMEKREKGRAPFICSMIDFFCFLLSLRSIGGCPAHNPPKKKKEINQFTNSFHNFLRRNSSSSFLFWRNEWAGLFPWAARPQSTSFQLNCPFSKSNSKWNESLIDGRLH